MDIPGVGIRYGIKKAEFYILKSLDSYEWGEVQNHIGKMLDKGYSQFIFCLQRLSYATSTDLGMWVTLNAKIVNNSGSLVFSLGCNNTLRKYLTLTGLDKILTVKAKDLDSDGPFIPYAS
jgi:anti-anti-sigma factor